MGLVNRIVEPGQARPAAEQLATEIASFPATCMRNDRSSTLGQHGLPEDQAMAQEFRLGLESLAVDGQAGAARFAAGAGRHGSPSGMGG